jgi:hypothetical protein
MTLLVKSRQSIAHVVGVSFTRGMDPVSLLFNCRMQDRFPTLLGINQQSQKFFYVCAELSQPYPVVL